MDAFTIKNQKRMRLGYTTGSCAAAASAGAVQWLLTGEAPVQISLQTPKGVLLLLEPACISRSEHEAVCAICKDSGDDPDVTNGIRIFSKVTFAPSDTVIEGGDGVGRVTKPGLACAVGEAAINPAPRKQIYEAVHSCAQRLGYHRGFHITISAENGGMIAKKTFNEKLGVIGGISILGTSGIVEPMSEKAMIDTIHVEMNSAKAQGNRIVVGCPGNYGKAFCKTHLGLDDVPIITMANYIGDTLDYAVYHGMEGILLIGHAGKLIKLAAGIMQTHSSYADGRHEILTAHAALCGAPNHILSALMHCTTVDHGIEILKTCGLHQEVFRCIGEKIDQNIASRVRHQMKTACVMFTNENGVLWRSETADQLIAQLGERTCKRESYTESVLDQETRNF